MRVAMAVNPAPQRIFPWRGAFDENRVNYNKVSDSSSAPGCFPGGVTAYGMEDMAGNVYEWTRSMLQKYPYRPNDGRENLTEYNTRVLRGGSWRNPDNRHLRCAFRFDLFPFNDYDPFDDFDFSGFRVCARPHFPFASDR